ncbi:MAG: hypothetical protein IPM57_05770 [Oligoflexia bacterium]|nr:hypothetical protein [Oligoflexia bacterium]
MSEKAKTIRTVILTCLVILGGYYAYKFATRSPGPDPFIRKRGGPCPGETKTMVQNDPYMRGVIEQGQKFRVILNYYDCNKPKRGELVLFQIHQSMDPVVKIIRGVQNDRFKLIKDVKRGAWNLEVEDDIIYSLVNKDEKYFFGGNMAPPLSLYERSHNGKITGNGDVILLSSWPPGSIDSGQFGMFNLADVVGKVELIDGTSPIEVKEPNAQEEPAVAAETPQVPAKRPKKPKAQPQPTTPPAQGQ